MTVEPPQLRESPSGQPVTVSSGGALVNLANTVWVDRATTVAPADQTGNIEAPFSTLAAARAALIALGTADRKNLIVQPGDYSAEPVFVWDGTNPALGPLVVQNGSWLQNQFLSSLTNVTLPGLTLQGSIAIDGCVVDANIGGNADLYFTSCKQFGGTIACSTCQWTNCESTAAITCSNLGSCFRNSTVGDISTPGDTPSCITFLECEFTGDVTFTLNPGVAFLDTYSYFAAINNGKAWVNGRPKMGVAQTQLLWFGADPGALIATDILRPFMPSANVAAQEGNLGTLRLEQFGYVHAMRANVVAGGSVAGDCQLIVRINGVDTALDCTIPDGNDSAENLDDFLTVGAGGADVSVRLGTNTTPTSAVWVTLEFVYLPT